ncbi:MAG: hypothetical protein PVF17_00325 [Ignavibacteria bacterium]|jgi:hypothetical protein
MPVDIYNDSSNSISGEASAAEQLRKLRNMKQEEDARKAMQLDQLVKARIAEQEAANQMTNEERVRQDAIRSVLERMKQAKGGMAYESVAGQPPMEYEQDQYGTPIPAMQRSTGEVNGVRSNVDEVSNEYLQGNPAAGMSPQQNPIILPDGRVIDPGLAEQYGRVR